ncbi:hypothetical protein AVEN_111595-1 [Araneus ventricosus]|uniref:Uncharacterized protein n=1 Tax=Araneus ventricosus TaxID=182803 RepID=A0A4Y2C239_ARAVE|nr:hypothetical protein AVEN_111595-1 [Araneus ventricosus]
MGLVRYVETNLNIGEFWKYHLHIVACLKMGVTKRTLTSVWKKLWPESVVECDFEGFETIPVKLVVNEIVSLTKIVELELDNNMTSMSLWKSLVKS